MCILCPRIVPQKDFHWVKTENMVKYSLTARVCYTYTLTYHCTVIAPHCTTLHGVNCSAASLVLSRSNVALAAVLKQAVKWGVWWLSSFLVKNSVGPVKALKYYTPIASKLLATESPRRTTSWLCISRHSGQTVTTNKCCHKQSLQHHPPPSMAMWAS